MTEYEKENMRCLFWGLLSDGRYQHLDCGVILNEKTKQAVSTGVKIHESLPQVCPCECTTCKRAWFAAGRPSNPK